MKQYFFEIISKENGRLVYGIFKDGKTIGIATAFVESEAQMIVDALNAAPSTPVNESLGDAFVKMDNHVNEFTEYLNNVTPPVNEVKDKQPEKNFILLLNEGEEDEQVTTLVDYITAFDEDLESDFMPVINLTIGETYQYGADSIKRISQNDNQPDGLFKGQCETKQPANEATKELVNDIFSDKQEQAQTDFESEVRKQFENVGYNGSEHPLALYMAGANYARAITHSTLYRENKELKEQVKILRKALVSTNYQHQTYAELDSWDEADEAAYEKAIAALTQTESTTI